MARSFHIASKIDIAATAGLSPPPWAPTAHVFDWVEEGTWKTPPIVRIMWHPISGEAHFGTNCDHRLVPYNREFSFQSYLRSILLPGVPALISLPYYWPEDVADRWDEHHAILDAEIRRAFKRLTRVPRGILTFHDPRSPFLRARLTPDLATVLDRLSKPLRRTRQWHQRDIPLNEG